MEKYDELKLLGRGSMGAVYLVKRKSDGAQLGLKHLAIESQKDRALALNELAILRSLEHVHIVSFEDSFVHKDHLCIAMEYCSGGDLAGLLARQREAQRRLPEIEVRSMIAQLAAAVAHVHSRKVLHRDIKSSNVLLRTLPAGASPAVASSHSCSASLPSSARSASEVSQASGGGRHHLLLSDFGVAKALESTKAMACTQCGTPYYLPPEV